MDESHVLENVVQTYESLLAQASMDRQASVQLAALAGVFGFAPDGTPDIFESLGLFLMECQRAQLSSPSDEVMEILAEVLGPWASSLYMQASASAWSKHLSLGSLNTLKAALAYERRGMAIEDEKYSSLAGLIGALIDDIELNDVQLADIEIQAYSLLRELHKAMDRGDQEAIRDAGLRLSGLVTLVAKPPSRLRRMAAAALVALSLVNDMQGAYNITSDFLADDRLAIEAEISPAPELPSGMEKQKALPEGVLLNKEEE